MEIAESFKYDDIIEYNGMEYAILDDRIVELYQDDNFTYRVKLDDDSDYVATIGNIEKDGEDINIVGILVSRDGWPYLETNNGLNRKQRRELGRKLRCFRSKGKRKARASVNG